MDSILEIIGQILGAVAVICGFVSYQMRTQKQLLVVNTITCAVFCAHYILIGAYSGFALNFLCTLIIFRHFLCSNLMTALQKPIRIIGFTLLGIVLHYLSTFFVSFIILMNCSISF